MNYPADIPRLQVADDQVGDTVQRFEALRSARRYDRRVLPFLKTLVDFDLACEIGYYQLAGCPLTIKQLLLHVQAPPATVLRRLDRLCDLGIVERSRSPRDGRVHELRLPVEILMLVGGRASGAVPSRGNGQADSRVAASPAVSLAGTTRR